MKLKVLYLLAFLGILSYSNAQNEAILIETENGTLGSDYEVLSDGDVSYIAPATDYLSTSNPGDASKVASFDVTFAEAGDYKLYIRLRVGDDIGGDDSFYYGSTFGDLDPTADDDWVTCNQLGGVGYTVLSDVVEEEGYAGNLIWKWIAFSDYTGGDEAITFTIEEGALSQTFQIGARENGLDIDKIAFGKANLFYTVEILNSGGEGLVEHPGIEPPTPPLADGHDKFLGCGYGPDSKFNFTNYWNQVTPGNAGKWGWVEGTRDNMSWNDLDEAYNVAMDSGLVFKHHVMVWGSQQPEWMKDLDTAEQRAELEEWFAAVAERYPVLHQVEVVNEALHQPPTQENSGGYIDALGGEGETGYDWILESFRMARNVFSDSTELMINEYGILNSVENTDEYLEIIQLLQQEDLVDAIGFQAHGFSHPGTVDTYIRNIDALASTGLPIYVTELDVDGLTDFQHVRGYMKLFPVLWEHPAVQGITLWGFRPAMWRGDQGAYLIDDFGTERPAMLWLRAYLKGNFVPNEAIEITTTAIEDSIPIGTTIQFEATVSPDTATLQTVHWRTNHSSIGSIDSLGLFTANDAGTVKVTAKTLEYGSTISDEIEIKVYDPSAYIHDDSFAAPVKIYPNPVVDNVLNIEGLQNINSLSIMDLNGRELNYYSTIGTTTLEINLDVPTGMYIIKLNGKTKSFYSKIVVR